MAMRRLYLFGILDTAKSEQVIQELHDFYEESPRTAITIYINSVGGAVADALAIYDVLRDAPCRIHTVALGRACSAAVIALLGAPRKYRYSYPSVEFMAHDVSWKVEGTRGSIRDKADHLDTVLGKMITIFTKDTSLTPEDCREMFFEDGADHYFTAEQALEIGLIGTIKWPTDKTHSTRKRSRQPGEKLSSAETYG